jgi:hypothetical protein
VAPSSERLEAYLRELEASGVTVERQALTDGTLVVRITVHGPSKTTGMPDGFKSGNE